MAHQTHPTSPHPTPAPAAGTANAQAPEGHAAPGTGPGGRPARMIIVLCFTITAIAMALIYWRWANVVEPSSYIIVHGNGDASLNGTVITVSTENRQEVVVMETLSPQNGYAVTIFLHPGNYYFSATHGDTVLLEGPMLVAHRRWKTIPLAPKPSSGEAAGTGGGDAGRRAGVS